MKAGLEELEGRKVEGGRWRGGRRVGADCRRRWRVDNRGESRKRGESRIESREQKQEQEDTRTVPTHRSITPTTLRSRLSLLLTHSSPSFTSLSNRGLSGAYEPRLFAAVTSLPLPLSLPLLSESMRREISRKSRSAARMSVSISAR